MSTAFNTGFCPPTRREIAKAVPRLPRWRHAVALGSVLLAVVVLFGVWPLSGGDLVIPMSVNYILPRLCRFNALNLSTKLAILGLFSSHWCFSDFFSTRDAVS
jgi:hypothetical protein